MWHKLWSQIYGRTLVTILMYFEISKYSQVYIAYIQSHYSWIYHTSLYFRTPSSTLPMSKHHDPSDHCTEAHITALLAYHRWGLWMPVDWPIALGGGHLIYVPWSDGKCWCFFTAFKSWENHSFIGTIVRLCGSQTIYGLTYVWCLPIWASNFTCDANLSRRMYA